MIYQAHSSLITLPKFRAVQFTMTLIDKRIYFRMTFIIILLNIEMILLAMLTQLLFKAMTIILK